MWQAVMHNQLNHHQLSHDQLSHSQLKNNTTMSDLVTPCCLIDIDKLKNNIARLSKHIGELNCKIRPHVKTHKSLEVTREIVKGGNVQGITVSTLQEANTFFEDGYTDILYAVGIVPNKLRQIAELTRAGCDIKVILDNASMAQLIIEQAKKLSLVLKVLIELDTDQHRSGIVPTSEELLTVARLLDESPHTELLGVMTHAGESYQCFTKEAQVKMARQEREQTLLAATRLRDAGYACPMVSIGSTPTAFAAEDLSGITEVRAGVYVFFDLVMAGLGVCQQNDIAISVLTTIIGHQKDKNWVITDAGWMALSRDQGTKDHDINQKYGVVLDVKGNSLGDYIVNQANQEHGIVTCRSALDRIDYAQFPIAGQLRILPNHACATAGQFEHFLVIKDGHLIANWSSNKGW